MKNKFIKSLLVILLFISLSFFSLKQIENIKADSGFDTSYDSGGSSGGSSFGSSHSSGGSSGIPIEDMTAKDLIISSLFLTVFHFVGIIAPISNKISKGDKKKEKKLNLILLMIRISLVILLIIVGCYLFIVDLLLVFTLVPLVLILSNTKLPIKHNQISQDEVDKVIQNFDIEEFNFKAYQMFYDVQMAWMEFDYDKLKELLTDELYNTYYMQLETLKIKNQKNTMKDFELIDSKLVDLKEENDKYIAQVVLNVKFFDYIENINTNRVLRGTSRTKVDNTYILTFIKTKKESNNENICPQCGSSVKGNSTGICKYCKSKLINQTYDWVMAKKEIIKQK